jgi:hypothetical protein
MKKHLTCAGLFISLFASLSAQTENLTLQKNKEITVMIGMANTNIKNANISQDENITINKKNGLNFSFKFNKYFKNRIGFGLGLGCSSYNQEYYQKGLYQKLSQIDRDGETYDKWISSDITYSNELMYFDIPVSLHLILGKSPRFYAFVDAGIINQFLIKSVYTEEGSIETMGRYATSNPYFFVVTQNNDYYGMKFTAISEKDTEKYKFYNLSGHLSFGLAAAMTDRLILRAEPFVNIGLSDIMGPDGKGLDYENVFGELSEYKQTKLFSAGISIGFAFNL